MLALSSAEIKEIDAGLESKMDWARTRSAEAEQLALDVTRLLSCTEDRLDHIKDQGFFARCWGKFSGKTGEMERANTSDLISMQKVGFRYINMLQEQQLMMAHSMLSLKNNLVALAIKEEETRNFIAMLAGRTLERFQALESRVDQLEVSTQLQGWILTIEDRDYEELYPQPYMRMLKVVNDFYMYKDDNWNYQDVLFMRRALRDAGINPKTKISIQDFIAFIVDDIEKCGFDKYQQIILASCPDNADFHNFAIENISSQSFTTIHGLSSQYVDKAEVINILSEQLSISKADALKQIFNKFIANLNVNLECSLSISDIAIEILGGLRLSRYLASAEDEQMQEEVPAQIEMHSGSEPTTPTESTDQEKAKEKFTHVDVHSLGDPKWEIKELDFQIKFIFDHPDYSLIYSHCGNIFKTYDFESFEYASGEFPLLRNAFQNSKISSKKHDEKDSSLLGWWPQPTTSRFFSAASAIKEGIGASNSFTIQKPASLLKFVNGIWVLNSVSDDNITYSRNGKDKETLDIKRLSQQTDAKYPEIFYDGEKWCVFFLCTDKYSSLGVLTSFDFENWDFFSSKIDFKNYEVESFSASHKTLVAIMQKHNGTMRDLFISTDGKDWQINDKIEIPDPMHVIPTSKGFVLLRSEYNGTKIIHINIDGGIIKIQEDEEFHCQFGDLCFFKEIAGLNNNSLFIANTHHEYKDSNPSFYISNDCLQWKPVSMPRSSKKEEFSLSFAHGKFIAYIDDNKIATWKAI